MIEKTNENLSEIDKNKKFKKIKKMSLKPKEGILKDRKNHVFILC